MTSVFLVLMVKPKLSQLSSRKVIHALLHFHFSVAVKSAVIRKEDFSQCAYLHLCFESSEVEHSSICFVLQLDAIVIIL